MGTSLGSFAGLLDLRVQAGPLGSAVLKKCLYAFAEVFGGTLVRIDLNGFFQLLVQPAFGVL